MHLCGEGGQRWQRIKIFDIHICDCGSFHNKARKKEEGLFKQDQSTHVPSINKLINKTKAYRIQLSISGKLTKGLVIGGLPFRGHNESENPSIEDIS